MSTSINVMDSLAKLGILGDRLNNATFPPGDGANNLNGTSAEGNGLPDGFMDSLLASAGLGLTTSSPLVQLVLFLHRQVGAHLGIDPSLLLTLLGVLWGAQYFFSQLRNYVEDLVEQHLMCSITISQNDDIYDHLMEWLSKQPHLVNNRCLTAQTVWKSAWEEDDDAEDELDGYGGSEKGKQLVAWTEAGQGGDGKRYLNFSNHATRSVSPQYCVTAQLRRSGSHERQIEERKKGKRKRGKSRRKQANNYGIGSSIRPGHGGNTLLAQSQLF